MTSPRIILRQSEYVFDGCLMKDEVQIREGEAKGTLYFWTRVF